LKSGQMGLEKKCVKRLTNQRPLHQTANSAKNDNP